MEAVRLGSEDLVDLNNLRDSVPVVVEQLVPIPLVGVRWDCHGTVLRHQFLSPLDRYLKLLKLTVVCRVLHVPQDNSLLHRPDIVLNDHFHQSPEHRHISLNAESYKRLHSLLEDFRLCVFLHLGDQRYWDFIDVVHISDLRLVVVL
jgi:hypothetical protein